MTDKLHSKLAAMKGHRLAAQFGDGHCRQWLCRNPKDGNAWFRVVTGTDMVAVFGDVGDRIVYRHGTGDIVPWLRGSVHSVDYLISKMPGKREDFDPNKVRPLFVEHLEECKEDDDQDGAARYQEAINLWDSYGDNSEGVATDLLMDADSDSFCDIVDGFYSPSSDVLWTVAALQTFIRLLDKDGRADA